MSSNSEEIEELEDIDYEPSKNGIKFNSFLTFFF